MHLNHIDKNQYEKVLWTTYTALSVTGSMKGMDG